ncbi:acetyl-coenzyme A synthetase [Thermobispora bispora]|uniref:Acetyl-coenzyme A synthetase n=1 Tax=Thermobispora bispora (strain ATCC 19993 / DSM 43833 / CBS 139.67 / JCM 10125 / KCTC 9307 / NBRC 14880 / R51) TaxID=469371 RepID=D6Y2Y2_THEBD|nr:acetate--CoA ligase [Thermobispora bispora]ADG86943.1 acetate/CoA ligase [Thermobispora bispora DSM 43833]MBO2474511.1 acetate--CoA ligase [Actinomycetales bacterium]MBX6168331.1 acetate--CoA ligase [Thermobispora bispora]QSI46926.1 acetate--CoA ligase [Thermobispora bispora]
MATETPGRETQETLSNLLTETRRFAPPAELAAAANVTAEAYEEAERDRLAFWERAAERLTWAERWHTTLEWNAPFAKWFVGGKLNVAYNCVDRHVEAGLGDRVAYYWEGEPEGHSRTITYAELQREVAKAANALQELGVRKGDRVAIYMPMIPELPIAMLACARIGAIHSVVFGGFSVSALKNRIEDANAKLVITADGGYRRGKPNPLKPTVDEAVAECPGVERVVVVRRTGQEVNWTDKDIWWHDIVDRQPAEHEAVPHDAEDPLFILYTSGTTGKPKGILHTTGGYLTQTSWTHWAVFDLKPETDIYWCTADIGWVTGHSYIVYGPLANAATSVIYEGTPDTPHRGRFWEIVQKYKVTILYTAPTAIRTFMKWGADIPAKFDLSSLRILGSVGEPINPEAYVWYREHIGGNRCPVVDTWWQTETGAIMITPLPGITHAKPGAAMRALPGIVADVVDDKGESVPNGGGGYLVIREPWPSMLRTIWGDDKRYVDTYWSRFEGLYFPGDGAKRDEDGDIWLLGRVDDVMLVSGHNISTTEVESALVSHPKVAEAAVVGASDPVTGQAIVAFVILRGEAEESEDIAAELRAHVASTLGPIAKPRQILVVPELPKTRSGKIMRRLLRDVAENRELGDVTTLTDSSVMKLIAEKLPAAKSSED